MENLLPTNATELAQTLGIAVLLFFGLSIFAGVMILYMKGENRKWEQRELHSREVYQSIITQVTQGREQDFELLKSALDDNREQISINRGLVEKIKTMQQTHETAMRDIFAKLERILENRCINHLKQPGNS
jgi:hypothetical protein